MASKKDLLSQLTRAELLAFVSETGLEVQDRRVREQLIAALSSSKRARPAAFLASFSAERLKQLAESFGSTGAGRNKAAIIASITSGTTGARKRSAQAPEPTTQKRRATTSASAAPLRATKKTREQAAKTTPKKTRARKA